MLLEVSLTLFVIYLLSFIIQTFLDRRKFPPGPFPLPIIGNMHQIGTFPPFTMLELCKKYPDVVTVSTPIGKIVFVNSSEAAREALLTRKTDFAGRPSEQLYPLTVILDNKDILTADYGKTFTFRSRVFNKSMHLFNEGPKIVERRLQKTISILFADLDKKLNEPFNLMTFIFTTNVAQLWEWLSSEQVTNDAARSRKIVKFINDVAALTSVGSVYQFIPLLRVLPSEYKRKINTIIKTRDELFEGVLDYHKRTYQSDVVRDITDAMLSAFFKEEDDGKHIGQYKDIMFLMIDVMIGGVDTSNAAIAWFILHIVLSKEIQTKMQEEFDRCFEKDSFPSMEDITKCHYFNAVVCEVMRKSGTGPLLAPHRTIRDTTIMGYKIPQNTTVLVNNHGVKHDPIAWKDPDVFRPERFLDENGKFVGWNTHPAFLPFGLGRRACPGKDLGKCQVLITLACLLHRYSIKLDENQPRPKTTEFVPKGTPTPKDFNVIVTKRC